MDSPSVISTARERGALPRLRHRVHVLVEPDVEGGEAYDNAVVGLVCLNVLVMILETVRSLHDAYGWLFHAFEVFSVAVFTADYLLRLWTAVERPGFGGAISGRVRFALTPMAVVDLVSILPFFLPFLGVDLRFARAFRAARLLRLAKLARYSRALQMVGRVVRSKGEELVSAFMLAGILLLVASALMYFAERDAQPDKFSSIPAAMWWGIATLTTVGYGDVYPVTDLGKFLSALIAILGIGVVALPTGILGAAFVEEMQAAKEAREKPVVIVLCERCRGAVGDGETAGDEHHHKAAASGSAVSG